MLHMCCNKLRSVCIETLGIATLSDLSIVARLCSVVMKAIIILASMQNYRLIENITVYYRKTRDVRTGACGHGQECIYKRMSLRQCSKTYI